VLRYFRMKWVLLFTRFMISAVTLYLLSSIKLLADAFLLFKSQSNCVPSDPGDQNNVHSA